MFREKVRESVKSVLPIALIILALSAFLVPIPTDTMLLFLFGMVCLMVGLSLFTMGVEMSMTALGTRVGSSLAKNGKVWLIALLSFLIGLMVTISEPDLSILARQVSDVPNLVLILTVSVGVGVFLIFGMLRILFHLSLSRMLLIFYALAFVLCFFVSPDFWSVAFDSGGVTTGPMTVPFIMAIGAGVSQSGTHGKDDSFGLVALCSIGPILAVMVLGICYSVSDLTYTMTALETVTNSQGVFTHYLSGFAEYGEEIGIALLPILVFALLFQAVTKSFTKKKFIRICVGMVYTLIGLVLFLTGANEGLLPVGQVLGQVLAGMSDGWLLIPVSMTIGYFIVQAEPAVYVLNRQVETITAGAVSASTMGLTLSIGVSCALGLSMLRILTGISILWILIPGYVVAFLLTLFVPDVFVGIAFDSGGVASGTMMSAFVLPLAIGACSVTGENIMTQAFGCVAFVALTPVIAIQICGIRFHRKSREAVSRFANEIEIFVEYGDEQYGK